MLTHARPSLDDLDATTAELVETHGFRNRWTAKVYQWCLEAVNCGDVLLPEETYDDCGLTGDYIQTAGSVLEEHITGYKGVPWNRLHGVDFFQIAYILAQ
jgi:hypothetical protein